MMKKAVGKPVGLLFCTNIALASSAVATTPAGALPDAEVSPQIPTAQQPKKLLAFLLSP